MAAKQNVLPGDTVLSLYAWTFSHLCTLYSFRKSFKLVVNQAFALTVCVNKMSFTNFKIR